VADKQGAAVDTRSEKRAETAPGDEGYVYQNRRYVGTKETIGYVVFDMAQSFNINTYSARFITNILQISLKLQSYVTVINGVWDVVNDVFTGAIVDKTRTRWGKFKPYLMVLAIPGTILTCLYWLLPVFFPGSPPNDMTKFGFYLALALI
jgi:Na+/melibiose symporter-like transporter